jgi:putative inorganic carbon (HCO3(-)) transporter
LIPVSFEKERIPFYLSFAAAVAPLFSGAVCNILIGMAIASMLILRVKPKMPPILLPIGLFFLGTLTSTLLSADPWTGRTGIRKFYLFLLLMLVYTTFRKLSEVRVLVYTWTAVMTASALWSMVQFSIKYQQARELKQGFYGYYTGERITGFMSHWMTLGGEEMTILLLVASLWFFVPSDPWRKWLLPAAAVILISLLAGYTRSIWLGTAVAGLYLIWNWKRWAVLLTPIPIALLLLANPADIRERVRSAFEPHGDTDSNQFRVVCRRTGAEMIKAHPWFGLGPEQPRVQFAQWIPADIPRPLPTGWYGHLHNLYYHYAAERGIPTLLVFLIWIGKMMFDFARALRRKDVSPESRFLLHGAIAATIGILFTGLYEVNLGDAEVLSLFLVTMACGYLAARETAPDIG